MTIIVPDRRLILPRQRLASRASQRGFLNMHIAAIAARRRSSGGLLDAFLTNLWGASGLQKLVSTYAGNCIKVRRSSDNTTQDIGFVGTALDTASLATFVGANNGFVSTWYDQSGGANDLAQATSGSQPLIVDTGTYIGNVLFDGVDDQMLTSNSSGTPAAFSAYIAGRDRLGAVGTYAVAFRHESGTAQLYQERTGSGDDYIGEMITGTTGTNKLDDALTAYPATYAGVFDRAQATVSAQSTLWINGTQQSSVGTAGIAAAGTFAASAWRLGSDAANFSRLALATFLIYEAAHASGTVGSVSTLIKPANKVDTFGSWTTNLWGLYALRRLISTYAGNCIKVRRSSDNTTQDIGFDATSHLMDAASLLSFVGAGSGYIDTWYDQSGGAKNATQATQANQPRIVNAGVVDRGITFDGSNDFLATPNSGTPSAVTMFLRGNNEASPAAAGVMMELSAGYDTNGGAILYRNTVSHTLAGTGHQGTSAYTALEFLMNPVGQVVCARCDRSQVTNATQSVMFSGGNKLTAAVDASSGTRPSGNFTANPWNIGARSGGTLAAALDCDTIAIYETAISDANVDRISLAIG